MLKISRSKDLEAWNFEATMDIIKKLGTFIIKIGQIHMSHPQSWLVRLSPGQNQFVNIEHGSFILLAFPPTWKVQPFLEKLFLEK